MNRWAIIGIFLAVIGLWAMSYVAIESLFPTISERGQFGDQYGAVNALFSGLAFAGVIIAIWLQRKDLELQRDELRLQREEMAASREQLAAQAAAQRGAVLATLAQLKISMLQTEVAAIEMRSQAVAHFARDTHGDQIQAKADAMKTMINALENELGKHVPGLD